MNKNRPAKFVSIDASTNNMAFALFSFEQLEMVGKINFEGNNVYEKCIDASKKISAFLKHPKFLNIDSLVIEHTVFMNSPKTAADLALVQGAIIGAAGLAGITQVGKVSPITWQSYIGNKKLTKEEQLLIRSQNPGKSTAWYKAYERGIRKQRTIKFIDINYDKNLDDNDVADACGIGHWALNNWDKALGVDK
jgi:hypothetical protein